MKKQTKIHIRKGVAFARTLFLVFTFICFASTIISADGPSLLFPVVSTLVGVGCFGISYALDYLLDDNNSPFMH